jgi:4-aminobutyrate aminotransferase-like enzyme
MTKYLDFVAGVSACSLGHQQRVNQAIKDQLDKYSHVWFTANIRKVQLNIASF